MAKKLRCYVNRHRWVRQTSDDGQSYAVCRDCSETDWDHYQQQAQAPARRIPPTPGGGTPVSGGGG
jgi:hypothetical protein